MCGEFSESREFEGKTWNDFVPKGGGRGREGKRGMLEEAHTPRVVPSLNWKLTKNKGSFFGGDSRKGLNASTRERRSTKPSSSSTLTAPLPCLSATVNAAGSVGLGGPMPELQRVPAPPGSAGRAHIRRQSTWTSRPGHLVPLLPPSFCPSSNANHWIFVPTVAHRHPTIPTCVPAATSLR